MGSGRKTRRTREAIRDGKEMEAFERRWPKLAAAVLSADGSCITRINRWWSSSPRVSPFIKSCHSQNPSGPLSPFWGIALSTSVALTLVPYH